MAISSTTCIVGSFLWMMMAADREVEDRQFGGVNVQPELAAAGSGLDRGRAERR